ncbi:unnamed protein product [Candidula unifasciata]|uniref:Palmitoyltransferase DHHC domain-containing protein n=1 Tax=Candidula unifasciata TaxID=100452 RepID=A0A8S3ZUT1_9EUPU|nr:unnamed protein product [Candidula unifasciata]
MSKCELSTKTIPATFAWSLIIVCTGLYFAFVCRYMTELYSYAFPIVQGVITIFMMLNLCLSTFMDPGIFPRAPDDEAKDDDFRSPLYKNIEIRGVPTRMKWCTTCQFYRPPRSSHCSSCDNCIDTFDHHCPWLNNCIGRRNYRYFLTFLLTLCLHIVTILAQCVFYIIQHEEDLLHPGPIIVIVISVIIVLVLFPVFGLTGFHIFLVSKGATTNEQVTGKFKGGPNPFTRGCIKNCCYVFYGPRWPKLVGYTPKTRTIKVDATKVTYIAAETDVNIRGGVSSNGIRTVGKNHYESHNALDSDDFMDKGSQSVDCEPSPLAVRKRGGSYTNLFDSVGNQQPHPSSGAAVAASTNSSSVTAPVPSQNSYAAQSRNTYDPPTRKVMLANVQNGGSLGRYKAPIVKEEEDTKFHSLSSVNSPGIKRSSSSSGAGIQSPSTERTLPSRTYSLKPSTRSNSPRSAASPPSHPGDRSNGRPPLSPHSPLPVRTGMKDQSSSSAPSASLVKDRARNFYPSRSRENLNKYKEQMKLGDRTGSSDYLSSSLNKPGGSRENLTTSDDKSSSQYNSSLDRAKGNEISLRQSPQTNPVGQYNSSLDRAKGNEISLRQSPQTNPVGQYNSSLERAKGNEVSVRPSPQTNPVGQYNSSLERAKGNEISVRPSPQTNPVGQYSSSLERAKGNEVSVRPSPQTNPVGQYSSSLDRAKGNEVSVRPSPQNNSLGRDRSKDYTSRSVPNESQPGDAHEIRYKNKEHCHREGSFPRCDSRDTYQSSSLRRSSEAQSKERTTPREVGHYPRAGDRSKSFDYDPPREKLDAKVWEQGVGRNHTLPRKLPEAYQKGYGNNINVYTDSGSQMNHVAQAAPNYHQFNNTSKGGVTILGRLDEVQTASPSNSHRINTFNSANTHQMMHPSSNILIQKRSPSPSPSITSPSFTSQPSPLSRKQLPDTVSNMRVLPVSDITEIREKRIGERLWRQNQIPHKEITKGAYDAYEASV